MSKEATINQITELLHQLPLAKVQAIADFAFYINKCLEEPKLAKDIPPFGAGNDAFSFLNDDADLYTEKDLKEIYHH